MLHESVANECIGDMDALENVLEKRCRELRAQPETIFSHALLDWWAHAAEAERTAA